MTGAPLPAPLPAPLIVTATRPPDLPPWATDLRARHFPPERNWLEAHVTLFHALPPASEAEVIAALKQEAARSAPIPARLEGVMSLGRGTALRLASPAMLALRDRLAERFHGLLTAQDAHRPRLHITVQNKVSTEAAKALLTELTPLVRPRDFAFRGLALYRYRGGPWEHVRAYPFRAGRSGTHG
ncbi:2'-5' RNA ligase family protein [Leptolyngbya sp. 15MV]|nr:2'-5' RNA ligase family protein [Leptolyngbya sp. 15MV]